MNAPLRSPFARPTRSLRERGVVLFVTLIVLVALSLAGIALIRSVDTATIVSGNLAFKQASISAADQALETVIGAFNGTFVTTANIAGSNYYASVQRDITGKVPDIPTVISTHALASASLTPLPTDSAGNKVYYVTERLCTGLGAPTQQACNLAGSAPTSVAWAGTQHYTPLQRQGTGSMRSAYRLTVRVEGPRNTVTYAQAMFED